MALYSYIYLYLSGTLDIDCSFLTTFPYLISILYTLPHLSTPWNKNYPSLSFDQLVYGLIA
jgi:hypothetical protein